MDSSLKTQEPQVVDKPETTPSPIAQEPPQVVDKPVVVPSPIAQEPDNDVPAPGNEFAEFAAGCFWGVELAFQRIPGVTVTEVGYTQGISHNPSYEDVCTNTTNHAEVVRVQFDPKECTYETLLDLFWSRHDPTTLNRQVSRVLVSNFVNFWSNLCVLRLALLDSMVSSKKLEFLSSVDSFIRKIQEC